MAYERSRDAEAHWRRITQEMPERHTTIQVPLRFPASALDLLFTPALPGEMEDKWIALPGEEETNVEFYRSWTGFHIYCVYLFEDVNGWYIDRVDVNRDPAQYSRTDDAQDARIVAWLMQTLLLGLDVPFPTDRSLPETDAALAAWSDGGSIAFVAPPAPPDDAGRAPSLDPDPDALPGPERR